MLFDESFTQPCFITGPITIGRSGPQCSVLYCADTGQVPDLAVLKITNRTTHHHKHIHPLVIKPSDYNYSVGEAVAVISYGLVRPCVDDDGPMVTKGAISKVIYHNGTPVMIQVLSE